MLVTQGGRFGGYGFYILKGKPVFLWNLVDLKMEHTILFILQWDENFDVGADTGTPVDDQDYQVPFEFNGKIDTLTLAIDRPQLTPADIEKLKAAQRNNKTSE